MKSTNSSGLVPAVNFHLWQPCNMRCKFCFATFQDVKQIYLPKGHLPKEHAISVTKALCEAGFKKITFVGGEPSLCPWLIDLIEIAKSYGLTTMMVTNGSKLTSSYLQSLKPVLDWVCISIDSLNQHTNDKAGRKLINGKAFDEEYYRQLITMTNRYGFRFKINTVVHALNYNQDMVNFIHWAMPERWKVFRVLPVAGQNNGMQNELLVSDRQFQDFVQFHTFQGCCPIAEDNDAMRGSYAMVDPSGRFFDSSQGQHTYSRHSILDVGVHKAYNEVTIDQIKFTNRGGEYDWKEEKKLN